MFHQRHLAKHHIFKRYCTKLTILHGPIADLILTLIVIFIYGRDGILVLMIQIFEQVTEPLFEIGPSFAEEACLS